MLLLCTALLSCAGKAPSDTLVMVIESSPASLDPRIGIDSQSELIGKLIFDALVRRDAHFNLQPMLAERWDVADPKTYIFHLRHDARFHDGRPLTARDVKWTFDSIIGGKVRTPKSGTYGPVQQIDAADDYTVVFHLKEPMATLLWNLSDGGIGIVPYGSGPEFAQHPVGSGPFRFVRLEQDKEVVLERNDQYWGDRAHVSRVVFNIVPDVTTRALELRKGSADLALNSVTPDMVLTLKREPNLDIIRGPGTGVTYLELNLRDPILKDARVRQALAYAIDRAPLLHYLWRDMARPAAGVLPPEHWAYDAGVRQYEHNPQKARELLDAAGYRAVNGVRFHLTMKTSTQEDPRLLAAVLQQQLRDVGIALDIRSYEFATFFSDVTKGAFQMYPLRWIGGNEDPDIFEYAFDSKSIPPKRANRGYYSNPKVDALIDDARNSLDQEHRRKDYFEVQRILAEDLPSINLYYIDNVLVHSRRVKNLALSPSNNYDFIKTAELAP